MLTTIISISFAEEVEEIDHRDNKRKLFTFIEKTISRRVGFHDKN